MRGEVKDSGLSNGVPLPAAAPSNDRRTLGYRNGASGRSINGTLVFIV